jgi:hypothetical protein
MERSAIRYRFIACARLAWYFMLPATAASTLLFGAIMGFLWMGVGPLVAGAEMFGLR